jgi:lysozyme family protein
MADFTISYGKTMKDEGGYANSSHDSGKETWKGIARFYHPTWKGWAIIDEAKGNTITLDRPDEWRVLNEILLPLVDLEVMVQHFYRENFWNAFVGGAIESQALADELFDIAVNMNPSRAKSFLQNGLNMLNSDQKHWPDIIVDGDIGPGTLSALRACTARGDLSLLLKIVNLQQGCHYLEQLKRPSQEVFARAWLSRVNI